MAYTKIIQNVDELSKKLRDYYQGFDFKDYVAPLSYDLCPRCHSGRLRTINGRYGYFQGCSNYPVCTYTKNIK